jgi:PKD repeat protein/KaiC/GvpD/RAD55 family RecA-like ATPase
MEKGYYSPVRTGLRSRHPCIYPFFFLIFMLLIFCSEAFSDARDKGFYVRTGGGEAKAALCIGYAALHLSGTLRGFMINMLCNFIKRKFEKRERIRWRISCRVVVYLLLVFSWLWLLSLHVIPVRSQSSDLLVFAEAPSFARLDDIDPSGWFYHAAFYNPTDDDIVVTGLRYWYNASVKIVDGRRNARCYDSRHFSFLPTTVNPNDRTIGWEYSPGSISMTIPAKEIVIAWIEVPTDSVNNAGILAAYHVEAFVDGSWISSPLYASHSGNDHIASTLFRADFNLTTDPGDEQQIHPNPQWLFNEDRYVIAGLSTRIRLIPVTSSRNTLGIDYATVNVTLPLGWNYVLGSAYNPYGESVNVYSVGGRYRIEWALENDVLRYSTDQSLAQNYIEFNVTAPHIPGVHNLTVTSSITSFDPETAAENQSIYVVVKSPPNASFTYSPTTILGAENVTFNATASYDLDGQIMQYFWDFGDGNTSMGNITTHAYTDNGTYTVTLTVTDNDRLTDFAQETIIVQNRPPIAQLTQSAEVVETDEVIYFNASDSYDLDGFIVDYSWDFDDGSNATGITVSHSYADDGVYVVTLRVTDDDGAIATANTTLTVLNRPPIATFTESSKIANTNEAIIFNATTSHDPDGVIASYFWDFGDGTNATGMYVSHAYIEDGNFTVTLTVTDDDLTSDVAVDAITILNRAPIPSFVITPEQPIVGETVVFNASASHDFDGSITSYFWDFGDGTNGTGLSATHIFASSGTYYITLTIIDNDYYENSTSSALTVQAHDVAILVVAPSKIEAHVGEVIDVTVTVKNEGTVAESFNVTLYCNTTQIGEQSVSSLAPNANTTLTFKWNTTGTSVGKYTIFTVADEVQGEIDVSDNSASGRAVEIKGEPLSIPPSPLPYLLPIGIGAIGFILGLVWKKRANNSKSAGFDFFDEMVGGGIPVGSSVAIIGVPASGKSLLCRQLAQKYLTENKACVFISYDDLPGKIRANMKSFGWDLASHEQDGTFTFIDCYSSRARTTSQEKCALKQPFALTELGIETSTILEEIRDMPKALFLDSATSLFTNLDATRVIGFLQDQGAKVKGQEGILIFTLGKGVVAPNFANRLEEAVDGIIELDIAEEGGKRIKRMRVKKMRGQHHLDGWVMFDVNPKSGIVFLKTKKAR